MVENFNNILHVYQIEILIEKIDLFIIIGYPILFIFK